MLYELERMQEEVI